MLENFWRIFYLFAMIFATTCADMNHDTLQFKQDGGASGDRQMSLNFGLLNGLHTSLIPSDQAPIPASGIASLVALIGGLAVGAAGGNAGFTRGLFNRRADARKRLIVNKRVDHVEGFTSQLYRLAEVFQKYKVDDPGCQLYVSCESSKPRFINKNARLAKSVTQVMNELLKPINSGMYKDDLYMQDLVSAYKVGTYGSDCLVYRKQCPKPETKKPLRNIVKKLKIPKRARRQRNTQRSRNH